MTRINEHSPRDASDRQKLVMFFDGSCPLCRREVRHYRRVDRSRRIEWIDINEDRTLLNAFGISYDDAMQRLHVLTRDGRMVGGAYAFAAVWLELPYYRWLAKFLYGTRTLPALDVLYGKFARWRYRQRCNDECVTSS